MSNDTQVPFGEQFQCERFEPAASPLGAVIDCDETFLSWTAPPDRPATEEPPQATPRTEPIPLDPALRAEVIDRIRTEAAATKIPPAPPEPAATSPDGTQAPEQAESMDDGACAASPDWLSPPVAPGSGGGDPDLPTPSPGGGGGGEGGGEEPYGPLRVVALWKDPCPCHCFCFPLGWLFPIFATFSGLVLGVGRLLQPDRSNLGVSDAWRPTPVIGPPDGFVDQLILEARQPPPPTYASPPNVAAGSAGLSDGHSPDVVHHVSSPVSQPRLLVAGLSQLGEPALRGTLPVPVGPGPGIPGIGSQPFFPADGSRFEAAPGAIFAGLAPATRGVGFGEFGERTALRPDRNGDVDREP